MLELDRELLEDQEPYLELHEKATGALGDVSPRYESDGVHGLLHTGALADQEQVAESLMLDPAELAGESLHDPNLLTTTEPDDSERLILERTEVEAYLPDGTLLEQGSIRFHKSIYVQNLFFRKVGCNIDNMKKCIQ